MLPLTIGRRFFSKISAYTVSLVRLPEGISIPALNNSARKDLPTGDFYSFIVGSMIVAVVMAVAFWLKELFDIKLARKPSIRNNRRSTVEVRDLKTWWNRIGAQMFRKCIKGVYLLLFVGFTLPLLFGISLDLYILWPLSPYKDANYIIFALQDWAIGCIFLKVAFNIILLLPGTRISRIVNRALNDGLSRCEISEINLIIIPIFLCFAGALAMPICLALVESIAGTTCLKAGLPSMYLVRPTLQNGFVYVGSLSAICILLYHISKSINTWIQKIRDRELLVGQRLHNIE